MKAPSGFRGELVGGVTTSVIALPLAIAFGVVAFSPLGPEHVAEGALAGLYAVIVAGVLTSFCGGTPGQISLPTAPLAVMVASVITGLLKRPDVIDRGEDPVTLILVLVCLTIVMAAILQWILAALGGGKLIKFIPYPVIAGFVNGVAVVVFLGQLRPLLGLPEGAEPGAVLAGDVPIRFEALAVGGVTLLAMLLGRRFLRAVPGSLTGLVGGIATYFLIGWLFNPALLRVEGNPLLIGPIPSAPPTPGRGLSLLRLAPEVSIDLVLGLIVPALALAVLASIDSLLTSLVTDMATRSKHGSTRELFGQGMGNLASAVFGGLPVAGSTLATLVNLESGGRTRWSAVANSATVLLVILLLSSLVQWIPMAALAGILLLTAVSMVETESIQLSLKRSALSNLLVIGAVTAITVVMDLIAGVVAGLAITAFFFIKQQIGTKIVHRVFTGDLVHSKKIRSDRAMRRLEQFGGSIKIYELQGSLFFGTCDKLLSEVDKEFSSFCVILDLKRVTTIDLTGAQLLKQIVQGLHEKGNHLLLSYLQVPGDRDKERMCNLLEDTGVLEIVGRNRVFRDTDQALEWAESMLLSRDFTLTRLGERRVALRDFDVFEMLTREELRVVRKHVRRRSYGESEVVFREGDPGDGVYFLISGGVSVIAGTTPEGLEQRVSSFGEGAFFGDMAILEEKPRSATVRADAQTEVFHLSVDDFRDLVENEPRVASTLLLGMARVLSRRLRLANIEVRTLEK